MTTGGYDPNKNPNDGNQSPQDPYSQPQSPPPGSYPPPVTPPAGSQPGNYPPQGNVPPPPGNYPPPGGYPPPGNYPPPQGNYPPPQGNYPPPGGYPPPPGNVPPQGGGYFPPPPANDYGAGFGGPQLSVGAALTYGWERFKNNALIWVGITLIAAVISIGINLLFGGFSTDTTTSVSAMSVIGGFVSLLVGILIQAAFVRGALHEVDGNKPAIGSFFQFTNVGAVVLASILVSIATGIGFVLLIIPGIIVAFLTYFTLQFVIDQNQDPVTAIKSSVSVISKNVGPLVLLTLALVGINIVGALLCGLGLLVTGPITLIAGTYAYRVITGRFVAPI
ncbi:hypothetical protein C7T36_15375 [Rhodococcus sp. AD45-ID]|uniref:hypothetical protein n=1 Tax=unclassified Rhodococcus (in: high G+C Gram-positive bacteria) TaxID=192944 RepID=UPI0005E14487|nr:MULTISPECIES: hypothetical protein [unclassified Rhodococcus (in: high G+C Gram-positive bacteria)]KJF25226.1 putative integral membrane protein [Rhodococcus sp. AD45]PSR43405.1 hypothetical protein C7T36_15375 [Rhodococcus sp. AD45-ID]